MKVTSTYFNWFIKYPKSNLKGDVIAGVTVGILLIPQGMAYALIAGLPIVYGLYAAILPQIIYAFLGSSKRLSVGPVALDSLIVAAGLGTLNLNPESYVQAAITLALLVGGIHILLGVLRLGFLVNFLSKPVISGFTLAAAITIGISQLKHITGTYTFDLKTEILSSRLENLIQHIHTATFILGISAIVFLLLLRRFNKNILSPILIVILGTFISYQFNFIELEIPIIEYIPKGLPSFQLPHISYQLILQLIPIALTLAVISYAEAISIAKSIEDKHGENDLKPNNELIALGFANMIGAFFQSYSVTGGFSRTAVNDEAGASSKMASLISALTVSLVLVFFTPLFYHLPKAILGAIIIVSVIRLLDFKYAIDLFKNRKDEFIVLIVTFLIVLFVGIKQGLLFGVILSLLLMIYRTSRPHIAVLGKVKGTPYFKNINRFSKEIDTDPSILILRFDAQVYFGNAAFFRKQVLTELNSRKSQIETIILNAESINHIDSSGIHMIRGLLKELKLRQVKLVITSAIGPLRDIFEKTNLLKEIGDNNFFIDTLVAYEFLTKNKPQTILQSKISLQSNKPFKI